MYLKIFFKIQINSTAHYILPRKVAAIVEEIPHGRCATAAAAAAAASGGGGGSGAGEQIENGFSRCGVAGSFKRRRTKAFAGLFAAGCYPAAIFRPSRSA